MNRAFNFGDTTMYVSALLKGRGLEASARLVSPVSVHLCIYEFCDGGLSLARPSESTDFSLYLRDLVDPRYRNNMVPEILSNTRYNDLDAQRFWQEKLNVYIFDVGLDALHAGVEELEINVKIHIHDMFSRLHEVEDETAELMGYIADEGIGGDFSGVPASKASIRALEVVKYNGVGAEFQENECSICLEEFEFEMEVTRMPCKHVFHGGCLTRWLERSHICPLCRYEMPI
ncbi:E3 ubiquitin-protein ligase Praja-1-like [Phoenix dactylifera]|uniref:E3 ubiquitin-protein ligase Praja-1-like n=1 Tax=Phoenix dactylifera TaxID=42345 RepID=A0A8B7CTI9_PHODC|nr:E3 ubiquitin-protein ligase Praja-1-like [Phoenix dactylifera]